MKSVNLVRDTEIEKNKALGGLSKGLKKIFSKRIISLGLSSIMGLGSSPAFANTISEQSGIVENNKNKIEEIQQEPIDQEVDQAFSKILTPREKRGNAAEGIQHKFRSVGIAYHLKNNNTLEISTDDDIQDSAQFGRELENKLKSEGQHIKVEVVSRNNMYFEASEKIFQDSNIPERDKSRLAVQLIMTEIDNYGLFQQLNAKQERPVDTYDLLRKRRHEALRVIENSKYISKADKITSMLFAVAGDASSIKFLENDTKKYRADVRIQEYFADYDKVIQDAVDYLSQPVVDLQELEKVANGLEVVALESQIPRELAKKIGFVDMDVLRQHVVQLEKVMKIYAQSLSLDMNNVEVSFSTSRSVINKIQGANALLMESTDTLLYLYQRNRAEGLDVELRKSQDEIIEPLSFLNASTNGIIQSAKRNYPEFFADINRTVERIKQKDLDGLYMDYLQTKDQREHDANTLSDYELKLGAKKVAEAKYAGDWKRAYELLFAMRELQESKASLGKDTLFTKADSDVQAVTVYGPHLEERGYTDKVAAYLSGDMDKFYEELAFESELAHGVHLERIVAGVINGVLQQDAMSEHPQHLSFSSQLDYIYSIGTAVSTLSGNERHIRGYGDLKDQLVAGEVAEGVVRVYGMDSKMQFTNKFPWTINSIFIKADVARIAQNLSYLPSTYSADFDQKNINLRPGQSIALRSLGRPQDQITESSLNVFFNHGGVKLRDMLITPVLDEKFIAEVEKRRQKYQSLKKYVKAHLKDYLKELNQ